MPFNSYIFILLFLPATVTGYWMLRYGGHHAFGRVWLLLASMAFYAYTNPLDLVVLGPSILLDYGIARLLLKSGNERNAAKALLFSGAVLLNIGLLGYFKYRNFLIEFANAVFGSAFPQQQLIIPLGISFLVFQKIAFLADVRAGGLRQLSLLDYLLFMTFFPRTIAGPIVHYEEVVPQLGLPPPRSLSSDLAVGLCLFSIGLFKKTVIADSVAQFVPSVFETPRNSIELDVLPAGIAAWGAVLSYVFQLYFDFSGYSDMALGAARMLGVRLPMNFNSPYKARNLVEFWGRWHTTLTRFLTTYIYTPLVLNMTRRRLAQGKLVLKGKRSSLGAVGSLVALPTLVTMGISGMWHGVGWQFIVWGLLHGLGLTANQCWRLWRPRFWPDSVSYEKVMAPLGSALTLTFVVVALVFFRASSVSAAISILKGMIGLRGWLPHNLQAIEAEGIHLSWSDFQYMVPLKAWWWIAVLLPSLLWLPNSLQLLGRYCPALDFPQGRPTQTNTGSRSPRSIPETLYTRGLPLSNATAILMALIFLLGMVALNQSAGFIYRQF